MMLAETEEDYGAEVIDFSDIGRGHNSDASRREYLDLRKSVWESNASTAEKLVALAIIEHMQPGKLNAYPSQSRLLKMCSVSPRTFRRAFAMVRAWFDVEVRPGRATVYSVKVVKTSKEIAGLLDRIRECQNGTMPEGAKKTPREVPKRHPTPGQNGTLPPANLAPQKRPGRDQGSNHGRERAQSRATPADAIPKCWQSGRAKMDAGTNPEEALAQRQVWLAESGVVRISDSFRDELAKDFPMVDPASALAAAAPNFRPDRGAVYCRSNVLRQFGYMQQDALRRQANAKARSGAVPSKQKHRKPNPWD